MAEIMIKAAGFVFVIIIAFILKQVHVLEKRDGLTIATIIMNVTLPCALLTNASGITIDQSMIILLLIGLASNIIMLFISFILSRKEENILPPPRPAKKCSMLSKYSAITFRTTSVRPASCASITWTRASRSSARSPNRKSPRMRLPAEFADCFNLPRRRRRLAQPKASNPTIRFAMPIRQNATTM